MKLKDFFKSSLGTGVINIAMVYVAMMLTRIIYFIENWSSFAPNMSWDLACSMLKGALVFDTSTIIYLNALYLVLLLLPFHKKETKGFHCVLKWVYIIPNGIAIASNLGDSVYFTYTGRRTTATVFGEFANEGNILSIIGTELVNHWYLTLAFIAIIWLMWKLYLKPSLGVSFPKWKYYTLQGVSLVILIPVAIVGVRGSVTAGTRPITISNANEYVNRPIETAVVLNTPFSVIRTLGKKVFETPDYMSNDEMNNTYTPVHRPTLTADSLGKNNGKNVVVIILEGIGKEYVGFYNTHKGYAPFIDSIAAQSLTFKYSFANGRKSMDAMPSILSGIPHFVETFFLTPASLNEVGGIARELGKNGYNSSYFHGGHNITLGFKAFTHVTGFNDYFGLDEYCLSTKYHGMDDFDGKWAIWDEEFMQFFADNLENRTQPFLTTLFTASSHHPYRVPDKYRDTFPEEGGAEMHKCVRYTDMALRRFFDRVKTLSWYENTLFVITADHTNQSTHEEYKTDLGVFEVPIIFYTPDGSLPAIVRDDVIAQQIDIMPTVLSYLGRTDAFMAFGNDLLTTPANETFAVNYNNGIYQLVMGDYLLQFDGNNTRAIYNFKHDRLLKENLLGKITQQPEMEHFLKAIIQQYMQRMNTDNLVVR